MFLACCFEDGNGKGVLPSSAVCDFGWYVYCFLCVPFSLKLGF